MLYNIYIYYIILDLMILDYIKLKIKLYYIIIFIIKLSKEV